MKWALVGLFWLFLVKNSQSFVLDDDYDEGECDDVYKTYCSEQNTFHDLECSGVCSNQEFEDFLTTAPEIGNFKKCCDMYSFENLCFDGDEGVWNHLKNNPRLCGAQGAISRMNFECPEGCKAYYSVNGTELDLNAAQGTVDLKSGQKQFASISDSCATYECQQSDDAYDYYEDEEQTSKSEDGYKMVFHICVCPKKEALKEDIKTNFQNPKVKQCCPKSYITVLDTYEDAKTLECPGHPYQHNQELRTCEQNFEEEIWQPHIINDTHFKLNGTDLEMDSEQFCIGQAPKTFSSDFEFSSEPKLIQHTLFHCPSPCTEGKPCLRKCCPDHKMGTMCDGPEANPDNYTMWKNLDLDVKNYAVFQEPSGKSLDYLSQSKCSQQFDLTKDGTDVLLKMLRTNKVYQPDEFCVIFQSDGTLGAKVVTRLEDQCADDEASAFWQEMNAKFEVQNVKMTKQFENLVERLEQFLESKFEEQARLNAF